MQLWTPADRLPTLSENFTPACRPPDDSLPESPALLEASPGSRHSQAAVSTESKGPKAELRPAPAVGTGASSSQAAQGLGRGAASEDDRWAVAQLSVNGEEVVSTVHRPQFLLLALAVLLPPLGASATLLQLPRHDGAHREPLPLRSLARQCNPALVPSTASVIQLVTCPAEVAERTTGHNPLSFSCPVEQDGSAAQRCEWLPGALPSWRWWAARALLAQQRLLAGRAASLQVQSFI